MRRHTPEYMTINKQRQENINNHLRKIRQQYSIHQRAASCSLTHSMHAARERTRRCAESALPGSLIMKFITLASTLVPRLRYLRDRFRRPCTYNLALGLLQVTKWINILAFLHHLDFPYQPQCHLHWRGWIIRSWGLILRILFFNQLSFLNKIVHPMRRSPRSTLFTSIPVAASWKF